MKTLKNLKLNSLVNNELLDYEMNNLRGGGSGDACGCGCHYANYGGSSTSVNMVANSAKGLTSYGGSTCHSSNASGHMGNCFSGCGCEGKNVQAYDNDGYKWAADDYANH